MDLVIMVISTTETGGMVAIASSQSTDTPTDTTDQAGLVVNIKTTTRIAVVSLIVEGEVGVNEFRCNTVVLRISNQSPPASQPDTRQPAVQLN